MKPEPLVSVVVVTFESRANVGPCLLSIASAGVPEVGTVVVDNASADGTADLVRSLFPQAALIVQDRNSGFAAAANLGAATSRGPYLLFLNPDAQLTQDALPRMLAHLERELAVAAVGPRFVFPDGRPQDSAFAYPTLLMTWLEFFPHPGRLLGTRLNGRLSSPDGRRPIPVDHPLGACMLVRRSAWDEVGPFDPGFFLYCEEVDWCLRAKSAGWRIDHLPTAVVAHMGGASAAARPGPSLVHLYRSRRRLHRKHRGRAFRMASAFITSLGLAYLHRRGLRSTALPAAPERLDALGRAARLART